MHGGVLAGQSLIRIFAQRVSCMTDQAYRHVAKNSRRALVGCRALVVGCYVRKDSTLYAGMIATNRDYCTFMVAKQCTDASLENTL
jgi:carbonic anhydrase/acetyltransferase-like protein (isoleucine patch superfamily)